MSTVSRIVLGAASAVATLWLAPGPAVAQVAHDPAVGTWELNRAKSTFNSNAPEKRVIRFEMMKDGAIREIAKTQQANGGWDEVQYAAKADGKDYPISGSVLDTVSLKRIDNHTIERMGKVKGTVVETRTRMISPDGRTMTITTKGTNNGVPYQSTQVFERTE